MEEKNDDDDQDEDEDDDGNDDDDDPTLKVGLPCWFLPWSAFIFSPENVSIPDVGVGSVRVPIIFFGV